MVKAATAPQDAQIAAAALRLAASGGWDKLTLDAVAKAAKVPAVALKKRFAGVEALVSLIATEIDREAFAAVKTSGPAHDHLFDLLMARFDVMHKHRAAILSMGAAARRSPRLARTLTCAVLDGVYRVIDLAGLDAPPRPVLALGIGAVYGAAFIAWCKDDSRDMAKTMAALDRALRYAGKAADIVKPRS